MGYYRDDQLPECDNDSILNCPLFIPHTATNCTCNLNTVRVPSAYIFRCVCVDCIRNVMVHAQKPDFVFRRNGRVHLNWRERKFSRLLAAEVCASAVVMAVMLDAPCYEVV
jgi:hypothetical protein